MLRKFLAVFVLLSVQGLVTAGCRGVVSRKGWDALDPVRVSYLNTPVSIVIIQHTVTPPCTTDNGCEDRVRSIQNYHMDNLGYSDVASSFYVGGNGKIYEGTGWFHTGAHTYGYNTASIGIAFIGNYNIQVPTEAQLDATKALLECGVHDGHLTQDYHVVGHKQLISTESPGRKLYNAIRRWPEWTDNVSSLKRV